VLKRLKLASLKKQPNDQLFWPIKCCRWILPVIFIWLGSPATFADEAAWEQYIKAGIADYQKGDYADAIKQTNAALKEAEAFGEEDPRFATSLNNLALVYYAQGRYTETEPLYKRALGIQEKVLGPEHPDVATSLNNLAELYQVQGRYAKAEPLHKRALGIQEKVLGPEASSVQPSPKKDGTNIQIGTTGNIAGDANVVTNQDPPNAPIEEDEANNGDDEANNGNALLDSPGDRRIVGGLLPSPPSNSHVSIDNYLASMASANIAFNVPQTINLYETALVQLKLSLQKSIDELREALTAEGKREGAIVKVSKKMEARLSGPNFQITAITSEEQAVGSIGEVEWKWEIKPTTSGTHNLHLTLTALFSVDGESARKTMRTFDKTIEIEVTPAQLALKFLENNWQWLWAAILVPIAGWRWKLWKSRKNSTSKSSDT